MEEGFQKLCSVFFGCRLVCQLAVFSLENELQHNYVFLGKSLVQSLIMNSGQNPIEPARLGCKIFHGPNVSNFVEIYEYLKTLGITKEINSSDELSLSLVEEFKEDKAKNHQIAAKIENYGQNIFNNVIIELKKYI